MVSLTRESRAAASKAASQPKPVKIENAENPLDIAGFAGHPFASMDPIKSRQEWTRLVIVGAILFAFLGLLTAAIVAFFLDKNWEQLITVLLAPITGLLGSALVFYFKTDDNRPKI